MQVHAKQPFARRKLDLLIRASEDWHDSYRKDRKSFRELVKMESDLSYELQQHFNQYAPLLMETVDWHDYGSKVEVKAAAYRPSSSAQFDGFRQGMYQTFVREFLSSYHIGADAQSRIQNFDLDPFSLDDRISKAAIDHAAELAKGITETTRESIAREVDKSFEQGLPVSEARDAIEELVGNADRADMIAKTESVNSFNGGVLEFGVESGAVSKTWQAVPGACPICDELDGQTVDIEESWETKYGLVKAPAAHPRCRCHMVLNYENQDE